MSRPDAGHETTTKGALTGSAERSLAVKRRLLERGYKSLKAAAEAVGMPYITMSRISRYGLADSPKPETIEAATKLGILDLVTQH